MNTRAAFLEAIIHEPADDAVRLIYADWLEEHGDAARAEFIRVQVERAKLPERDAEYSSRMEGDYLLGIYKLLCGGSQCELVLDMPFHRGCRWSVLRERQNELLKAHAQEWFEVIGSARVGWKRGFIADLTCTAQWWLDNHDALLAECPLEHVTLTECFWLGTALLPAGSNFEVLVYVPGNSHNADMLAPAEVDLIVDRSCRTLLRTATDGQPVVVPPCDSEGQIMAGFFNQLCQPATNP